MDFVVYILFSLKLDKFYTGYTTDIAKRIVEHNSGISDFTSKATDWKVVYIENFSTREEAMKRERAIKGKKSRKYIEWLVSNYPSSEEKNSDQG